VKREFNALPLTIPVNELMVWYVGYNVFSSSSNFNNGDYWVTSGLTPQMQWVVTDSALALTVSAAAVAIAAALTF
jgi:hypothetical protein